MKLKIEAGAALGNPEGGDWPFLLVTADGEMVEDVVALKIEPTVDTPSVYIVTAEIRVVARPPR